MIGVEALSFRLAGTPRRAVAGAAPRSPETSELFAGEIMKSDRLEVVGTEIRQAIDALTRALDGFDHRDDMGIVSLTYTARQLGVALRHIGAAVEPIMREID